MKIGVRKRKKLKRWTFYLVKSLLAIVIVVLVLFPLAWLFVTAIKTNAEAQQIPVTWIPRNPTLKPILKTWFESGYATDWIRYFLNTLKVTLITAISVVFISTLAGYGLARFKLRGKSAFLTFFLLAQFFWGPVLMIPVFVLLSRIGLYDTHLGLILVYIAFQTPLTTWLSYSNFQDLPLELEEAALVDGATQLGAFLKVTVPISKINMITIGIMSFLLSWSEYPFAITLLESRSKYTASVGLAQFISAINIYWNQMAAASLIISIPVLIILFFAQRYFVKGMTAGALK